MRIVSDDYKNQINQMGREIECIITAYKDNEQEIVLTNEEIIKVINDFEGNILKSVMKELDFETTINLSIGTKLRFQFGVKVNGEFEYVDYGYYYIKEKNKHKDTNTFEYICFDKMLNSMVDYDGVTANCNLREFINRLCTKINIDFGSNEDEFVNYDMQVAEDYFLFEGISYTYRDILDKIAEATASIICVNNNEELVVRYPNETNEVITKDSLYNNNILVDEVYGPVNSLTITRADTTDNINIKDDFSIETYGKIELTITENEFLQGENRTTLLENIFNSIKGLKYNVLDINTTGITYLELGDYYDLNTSDVLYPREDLYPNENLYPKGASYKCLMLGSTLKIQNGLNENLYCNVLSTNTPEFVNSHADEIDRNTAKIIVDKKLDEIDITADKIHLEGYTTINNGFSIDEGGNMTCNNAKINGDLITPNGGLLTKIITQGCIISKYLIGEGTLPLGYARYEGQNNNVTYTPSYIQFDLVIPKGFIPKDAYIYITLNPMYSSSWLDGSSPTTEIGYCRNLKLYKVSSYGKFSWSYDGSIDVSTSDTMSEVKNSSNVNVLGGSNGLTGSGSNMTLAFKSDDFVNNLNYSNTEDKFNRFVVKSTAIPNSDINWLRYTGAACGEIVITGWTKI